MHLQFPYIIMIELIENAQQALANRTFFAAYPELPKAYAEGANEKAIDWLATQMNSPFNELLQVASAETVGDEASPYYNELLGITYPFYQVDELIQRANSAWDDWHYVPASERGRILVHALDRIKERFFDIAYATMHTTGQSFMMSFQASGPHANDRALEAISLGLSELTRYPAEANWIKPMGKFELNVKKIWKAVGKGIGVVIGCSTFPVWNSVPGIFATLVTGSPVIVKPHPGAILPIAIVVAELQKVLVEAGFSQDLVQLAADTKSNPITKELAENNNVRIIDYTGNSGFGNYIESLPNKEAFTEKAGVNCVILDSTSNLEGSIKNIATAACLYSGQMCTAPQNFFIPEDGVRHAGGIASYDDVVLMLINNIKGITAEPKMVSGLMGAIQSLDTLYRVSVAAEMKGTVLLTSETLTNEEFPNARVVSPLMVEVDVDNYDVYSHEWFGPIILIVKTKNTDHSIELAQKLAREKGAISCGAYTDNDEMTYHIADSMDKCYTPVAFNLTGPIWMNQNAAFSDFHVTGGNPAGNATFTDVNYIARRFAWVGHKIAQ